jgi:ubiquinone/menaquinone biosynthesis C-methylase UbiE
MPNDSIKADVQANFGAHAQAYVTSASHAKGDDLAQLVDMAQAQADWLVLDVATGGGHTGLMLAPRVKQVIALDLTEAMLHAARTHAETKGVSIAYTAGDAECLPFGDAVFDLVICRIAPHHFPNIEAFMQESARVLKLGGLLVIQDHLLPDSKKAGRYVDAFEKLRDPSHVRGYASYEWRKLYEAAGFAIEQTETFVKAHDLLSWAERMGCDAITIERLQVMLMRAPAKAAVWLNAKHAGTPAATFDNHHILIRGRKPS